MIRDLKETCKLLMQNTDVFECLSLLLRKICRHPLVALLMTVISVVMTSEKHKYYKLA